MHLRPGLSPGPRTVGTLLEELTMLPRPPSWIWGWEGKRRGGREKGGEEERKGRGGAGWGKGGEGVRVAPPPKRQAWPSGHFWYGQHGIWRTTF